MFKGRKKLGVGGFSPAQIVAGAITTAALTFALLSASAARAGNIGAANPTDGMQHYTCGDVCYGRYYVCLMNGYPSAYCATQYSTCLSGCGGGALIVAR